MHREYIEERRYTGKDMKKQNRTDRGLRLSSPSLFVSSPASSPSGPAATTSPSIPLLTPRSPRRQRVLHSAPPVPSFCRSAVAPRNPSPRTPSADALIDRIFSPLSSTLLPPASTAVNRIYHITAANVAALQASAGPGRTKFEAFTAHLWQLSSRAASPHHRLCCMGVVVDGRARMSPDSAMKAYFGNVLTIPYGVISADVLRRRMALADVADDVHRWVREAATCEHFRGLIDWVEALRPEPAAARAYLGGTGGVEETACIVSSGLRFPVHEADFGTGMPVFASYHFPWPAEAAYVMPMPSARGDGDWIVYVHASPELVQVMEEVPTVFKALKNSYVFG